VLKKSASSVLAPWPCSRTPLYAPPAQAVAALLDGLFEHPAFLMENLYKLIHERPLKYFEFFNACSWSVKNELYSHPTPELAFPSPVAHSIHRITQG
jgi:hypothetical protein